MFRSFISDICPGDYLGFKYKAWLSDFDPKWADSGHKLDKSGDVFRSYFQNLTIK